AASAATAATTTAFFIAAARVLDDGPRCRHRRARKLADLLPRAVENLERHVVLQLWRDVVVDLRAGRRILYSAAAPHAATAAAAAARAHRLLRLEQCDLRRR